MPAYSSAPSGDALVFRNPITQSVTACGPYAIMSRIASGLHRRCHTIAEPRPDWGINRTAVSM